MAALVPGTYSTIDPSLKLNPPNVSVPSVDINMLPLESICTPSMFASPEKVFSLKNKVALFVEGVYSTKLPSVNVMPPKVALPVVDKIIFPLSRTKTASIY